MAKDNNIVKSAGIHMLIACLYYQHMFYGVKEKLDNFDEFFSDFAKMWSSIPKNSGFQCTLKPSKAVVRSTLSAIEDCFFSFSKQLLENEVYFDTEQNKFYSFSYNRKKVDALPKARVVLQVLRDANPGEICDEYLIEQFAMLKYLYPSENINTPSGYSTPSTSTRTPPQLSSVYADILRHFGDEETATYVFTQIGKLGDTLLSMSTNQRQVLYNSFKGDGTHTPTPASTSSKGKGKGSKRRLRSCGGGLFSYAE